MRHLLTFACEGATLGASLDEADGSVGVLLVTGGSQTRVGSHRMYERLAAGLSELGYPAFRFDRRGVGDSEGADAGFRASEPDLLAAVAAFRWQCPHVSRVVGIGLCDGATALALFGRRADLDGLVLINPWLVEAEAGQPPAAAVKRHYRQRLLTTDGWRRLLTGSVSYRKLLDGLIRIARPQPRGLADAFATALADGPPTSLILARSDATAIAAEAEWNSPRFATIRSAPIYVETNSHTFAKAGDAEALLTACIESLRRLSS